MLVTWQWRKDLVVDGRGGGGSWSRSSRFIVGPCRLMCMASFLDLTSMPNMLSACNFDVSESSTSIGPSNFASWRHEQYIL